MVDSTLEAALCYLKHGWAPIDLPYKEKRITRKGWQKEHLREADLRERFNGQPKNLGVLLGSPSGGLVDVDEDCPEARSLAPQFLPETGLVFGRAGARASHRLYVADPLPKYAQFADPEESDEKRAMLVELRSTGQQTVMPPSTHPSGERVEWEEFGQAGHVDGDELLRNVRMLAAAVLLARHWPSEGQRHWAGLALHGGLIEGGFSEEESSAFVGAVARVGGDDQWEDRARDARTTAEKVAQGKAVKSWTQLAEIIGDKVVRKAREWLEVGATNKKKGKRNQADRLIDYAIESGTELFVDQVGMPHALVDHVAVPLNSRAYPWLRRTLWKREGCSVSGDALKTATGTLAAFAADSGDVRELHTRAAFHRGAVYYRLDEGQVVEIDRNGWRKTSTPPVLFRSVPNLKPLPDPERGGSLDGLEEFVNLKTERDKRLFKAYVVTVPLPHIPRPMLQATGAMGSGKTTLGRLVKRLLDPTAPETVRADPRDFLQKASHAYMIMLDNQNGLPEWAVDTLCRLVTGEADSKRSLYTDDDDFIYEMKRAVLLNGINPPTERSDAQDRTLPVELARIPDGERKSEEELWERFGAEHGKLLGAVFDAMARMLRTKENLTLARKPRLADWGIYAAALYEGLGWQDSGGANVLRGKDLFLSDWGEVVEVQTQSSFDGSPVAQAIMSFMGDRREYVDFAAELHKELEKVA